MDNSLFPPYNLLAIRTEAIYPDWGAICRTVPTLPQSQKEDICKLIMEYQRLSLMKRMPVADAINSMKNSDIPYEGKSAAGGKGVILSVAKIPADLQLIIARYVIGNTT